MNTVIDKSVIVNPFDTSLDTKIQTDEEIEKELFGDFPPNVGSHKKQNEKKTVSTEEIVDKLSTKKEKKLEPTIEYVYVKRQDVLGRPLVDNYRSHKGFIYRWTNEYWQVQDPDLMKKEIAAWLEARHPTQLEAKKVSSIFAVFCHIIKEFGSMEIPGILIPTRKHWLSIDEHTGVATAIKPNKSIPLTYQIDVEIGTAGIFSPSKTKSDSVFCKFITSSLADEPTRAMVQQYAGLTLCTTQRLQKCQMWIGMGANGKSAAIEMFASMHSKPIATKLSDIGRYNDHFIGASIIYATEMDKGGFDQEFLKSAVAGDMLEVRGIYGKKQSVTLTAKFYLIGNNAPKISDFSNGLFRRIDIITWPENFENSPKQIDDIAKLVIKNEKPELLNWMLQGLQDLIANKWKIKVSEQSKKAHDAFVFQADKIRLFASDCNLQYDQEKVKWIDKEKVFESFNTWANRNNFEQMSSTGFWMRIKNIFPELQKDSPDLKRNGRRIVHLHFNN